MEPGTNPINVPGFILILLSLNSINKPLSDYECSRVLGLTFS